MAGGKGTAVITGGNVFDAVVTPVADVVGHDCPAGDNALADQGGRNRIGKQPSGAIPQHRTDFAPAFNFAQMVIIGQANIRFQIFAQGFEFAGKTFVVNRGEDVGLVHTRPL